MVTMVSGRLAATMGFAAPPVKAEPVRTSPLRLTRRGRVVAAGVSALLIGGLSMGLATTAQAARDSSAHSSAPGAVSPRSAAPGRYLTKVTVRPGDNLFSLAEEYDPDADPRATVQQVLQMNGLAGDEIQPGEVLWIPRD